MTATQPALPPGRVIHFSHANGYGVEPCPGCGNGLKPGQPRTTQEGVWRVWHTGCWTRHNACPFCDQIHSETSAGECLL